MRSFSNERRAVCFSDCSSSSSSNIILRLSRVGYRNVYGRVDVAGCGAVRLDPELPGEGQCSVYDVQPWPSAVNRCYASLACALSGRLVAEKVGVISATYEAVYFHFLPDTATFQIVRASISASIIHRSHLSCMGRTPRKKGDVFLADFGVHGSMGDRYVIRLPDLNRNFSDNLLPVSIVTGLRTKNTFFSRLKCTKCNFDWSCARELRGFSS